MKSVAIIQARMGSTRLPGKVMMDLCGETVLARVVSRTTRAHLLDEVVVATTTGSRDDAIARECALQGWPCFRGSEEDVLDRYYQAAEAHGANVVVRITSDCPLIEPQIIDLVLENFIRDGSLDYASNTIPPRTFPRGLDVEGISFAALARAWREDKNPAWREHVTVYLHRHPERFNLCGLTSKIDYSDLRWTVDTAEDLELVRRIYTGMGDTNFSWTDALNLVSEHPEWLEINRNVTQKQVPD